MDKLERHYGQRPVIYTAPDFYRDNLKGAFLDYPFWLRAVAQHPSKVYPGRKWLFWQYSGSGLSQGCGAASTSTSSTATSAPGGHGRADKRPSPTPTERLARDGAPALRLDGYARRFSCSRISAVCASTQSRNTLILGVLRRLSRCTSQ